ncbi:MAG TPA: amidoligase family protein [Syntrophobacteria bacterium]|nr:amidoligase family protein [Syntrophobacteria bacterium]
MPVPQGVASQLRQQYPLLHYFTDRPFGVEIEICGLGYVVTPLDGGIIKPYNISSRGRDARWVDQLYLDHGLRLGADRDSWHFEEDGSIIGRGGAEFISPILSGLDGLIEVYRALKVLCEIDKVKINASCGFHVHHGVDRETYTCEQLKALVRIVRPMEAEFYLLIPGERKNAETCRPLELDVEAFLKDCDGTCEREGCRARRLWYSKQNRYDPEADRRYDRTRYHGLNLHSYWYRSTIEFRYHAAVLENIHEAMQWIIFTQFLVEMSRNHIPIISFDPKANKWLRTIYTIYRKFDYSDRIQPSPGTVA